MKNKCCWRTSLKRGKTQWWNSRRLYRFIAIADLHSPSLLCIICGYWLCKETMKASKLLHHMETKHPELKYKSLELKKLNMKKRNVQGLHLQDSTPSTTTDGSKSTKTQSAWGGNKTNLSKERGQKPFPQWAFIRLNLHRIARRACVCCVCVCVCVCSKAQLLSGSNDQRIDNIQRTMRAYLESGSDS